MEMVLRTAAIYFTLLVIFKVAGRRALMQSTSFDLVLLLITSEATQQAMLNTDYSVTGSMLIIVTLVSVDILFGCIKKRFSQTEDFIDGSPVIVVENGAVIDEKIKLVNIFVDDVLLTTRQHRGIYELKAIKFAILERNGRISIIPKKGQFQFYLSRSDCLSPDSGARVALSSSFSTLGMFNIIIFPPRGLTEF